jgi:hypothetical protein
VLFNSLGDSGTFNLLLKVIALDLKIQLKRGFRGSGRRADMKEVRPEQKGNEERQWDPLSESLGMWLLPYSSC